VKRVLLTCLLVGAAGMGLWFGMEARREAPRLAAIEAVCRAVEDERYDDAIAQSETLAAPDTDGRIAAECRCWALLNRDRREDCAALIDDVLQEPDARDWVPHPVLATLVARNRVQQGRAVEAANLARAAADAYPSALQILELEIQTRSAVEGIQAAHQAIEARLEPNIESLPLRIALAASYLGRFDGDRALAALGDEAPPSGHPLHLLWFENRARAIATGGDIDGLRVHFDRWAKTGADPIDLRARYALRVSVSHLRDPEKADIELLEEALVNQAQLGDAHLRWALYRRLIGTLIADARIDDALAVYDEAVNHVEFPNLGREEIARAALPELTATGEQEAASGVIEFRLDTDDAWSGSLLVSPDPREAPDAGYEVQTILQGQPVRVERGRAYTPQRWVLEDDQGRTRGSGMVWPQPGQTVTARVSPREPGAVTEPVIAQPGRAADGRRRVFSLILDCADWRLVQYLRARGELPFMDAMLRNGYRAVLESRPAFTAAAMEALVWPERDREVSFLGLLHRMGLEIGGLSSVGRNPFGFLSAVLPSTENLFERLGAGRFVVANMLFSHGGIAAGHHAQTIGPLGEKRELELAGSFRPLRPDELERFPQIDLGPRQRRRMETIASEFDSAVAIVERGEVDLLVLRIEPLDLLTHAFFRDLLRGGQDDGRSPLLEAYRYIDWRLTDVMAAIDRDDVLIVMSDHGIRTPMEHEEDAIFVMSGPGVPQGRAPGMPHLRGVPRIVANALGVETRWPDSGVASWLEAFPESGANVALGEQVRRAANP
jgi:hypothetical protein